MFKIIPLVRKQLTPAQERASFINMLVKQGKSYQQAIREFDTRARTTHAK
jgi:hypothetical protein